MRVVVVIPCYNEAKSIAGVVSSVKQWVESVIVVDDNSTDGTSLEAERAGACVVKRFGKRGFGASTRAGIAKAVSGGCDIVLTLDGDGQHDPSEISRVLEPIEKGEADVVIGSRFLANGDAVPKYRKFGIKVITWLYNLGSKQKVTDAQCCLRAYRSAVFGAVIMHEDGFTFSTETLIKARAYGFRVREVPVKVYYHKQLSRNSTLNPIIHGICVALGTLRLRLRAELPYKVRQVGRKIC